MTNVFKYLLLVLLIQIMACTEQGDPIKYSLSNTTDYNMEVVLFNWYGQNDTTLINKNDFKIMAEDVPPYDEGPFGGYDSLKIRFEDLKVLTYIPPGSNPGCIDSIKNPFCPYSNYICTNNICVFDIDSIEYHKAK